MKFFSIAFTFALSGSLFSQITLSGTDFAAANDTVRISQTMDPVIDYTLTGEDMTWDFSGLSAASQYLKKFEPVSFSSVLVQVEFGVLAATPYKASYFVESRDIPIDQLNQFLPVSLSDLNAFSRKNSDSITSIGYSLSVNGEALPFKSDTIETHYKYPLNYEDTFNTRGYTSFDFNPATNFKIKQYRQRTTVVDGYGTLITPLGSFQVLRLKSTINEIDSVYQTFFGVGGWNVLPATIITEYEWWTNSKDEALLKIVAVENNGTSQIRSIEYQDVYLGLDANINELTLDFNLSPNPTTDFIVIKAENSIDKIVIQDLNGAVIFEQSSKNEVTQQISTSHLSKGIYFVSVFSGNRSATKKIIKL